MSLRRINVALDYDDGDKHKVKISVQVALDRPEVTIVLPGLENRQAPRGSRG